MDERHYISLFTQIIENFASHWPSQVQGSSVTSLIKATLDLYAYFERHVKPTPSKYLYIFNTRHMFKIIYGMAEIDPNYLKSEYELAKLWIHESWRTLCDRIYDYGDKKILYGKFNEVARKHFKIGKNKLSKKIGYPFFCSFNNGQDGLYTEVEDMKAVTQNLRRYLSEYNEIHKRNKINVILFEFLVEFMIKVHRIIKQPFSHGILIGIEGSGKHALSQLACFLANSTLYEIKLEANYTQDDWYNDLKTILQLAGLDQKEIVFHIKYNEIIREEFLDDLNTIINNGEIQGIFTKEEYENIISQTHLRMSSETKNSTNNQMILAEFSQKCRENLKMLLNFSPTGANLRSRIRNYKSIVNCSTIVWMESWPQEGYKEVAEVLLKDDDVMNRDLIIEIAVNMHQDTIQCAKNYNYETSHYLYITPHTFQEFMTTYKQLFDQKKKSLKELQERYEVGLERLKNTQDTVEKFQEQLENNSPMLIEKQIEIERIMEALKDEHELVGKRRDILMKEEQELHYQVEQAEKIKEECEFSLQKATPELQAAIAALQTISKNDIVELKTSRNPPQGVKLLMEAVCILLRVEPVKMKSKDGLGFVKDYWLASTGKHVLGNSKLVDILTNMDHSSLDSEMMQRLEELVNNPEFVYENISRASKAARGKSLRASNIFNNLNTICSNFLFMSGLFQWLFALKNYYIVYQETQPKRDALFFAEKQRMEKEEQIEGKRQELGSLEDNLNILKKDHEVKELEIRYLQKQIDEFSIKKERATKLLNGLGGERQKWLVCNRMIAKKFLTIQGDVLVGTAFINYLSAFTQKYREQCVEKWDQLIRNFGIRITDDFNFNKTFGDPIRIKEWNFNGLPSDSFSISNGIILENCSKQCICIDPQYQANKWIKHQEKDMRVLNFNDVNFVQLFEMAMKFGKKVLIENVGQKIELVLYPILRKEFVTEGGSTSVNIFGHMVELDKNFKLFITSEVRNPHFGPDISVMTNFVNFYVTLEGLEAQMLSIVISHQKADLEEESVKMKREALEYIRNLKSLENDILSSLHKDIDQILSDEYLIETLNNSKKTAKQIAENLQKVNKASNKLLKSRGIYTPAAYRAALLYFLISDLSKIEVMYQFSLKWYIDIFTEEVKQKKHTDQDPLLDIIKNFTHTLFRKVCQSIFEKDKLLFTFLLAFRILEGENCLNQRLIEFFIKGPQLKGFDEVSEIKRDDGSDEESAQNTEEQKQQKAKFPWISEQTWKSLEKLSKIPPFHKPNIVEHIQQNPDQWYQYIFAKESENAQVPGFYTEFDFDEINKKQEGGKYTSSSKMKGTKNLNEIKELPEDEDEKDKLEDNIWELDEDKDDFDDENRSRNSEDNYGNSEIDQEQLADPLMMGVSEYNEFRLGSVRFEKEMVTKRQQVLKDLIKFCIIRCFRPDKIVREVQRFLGSVLDTRFMEPPVFNLQSLFKDTSANSPILFILSPNINTLNELHTLKYQMQADSQKIEYMPLGSNINDRVQQLIIRSAKQGNWLLLENLHLVTDWIPTLEKFIQTMYKEDKREKQNANADYSDSEMETYRSDALGMGMGGDQAGTLQGGGAPKSQFPELRGMRINQKFRLFLSSMPVDYFPVSFLQDCMKITLQPAQGIRQNALKILNSVSHDFLYECPKKQSEFRKLFFALCIFHSVVGERQRFGPIGWSQPYLFSENDFMISSFQLKSLLEKIRDRNAKLPLELLRYLIGTLNYGGKILKKQDEIILKELLYTFIQEKTTKEQAYRLTGLDPKYDSGIYYVPGDGDLHFFKMSIQKFPIQDRPEIFGLHENATIMRTTNEGKILLERMFEFEFASKEMLKASSMIESNEDAHLSKYSTIKKRIQIIIEDLPELLDEDMCSQKYPISFDLCINTLITKEVQRFNMLLQVIYVSLKNTLKALEGVIHINTVLEEIYKALTYEQVPKTWFKYCYPTFKSLGLFLVNLKERVQFIRDWLHDKHPTNFWLPGLFDQQSFFTMLLQQKARNDKISIDLLSIEYKVLTRSQSQAPVASSNSNSSCFCFGLWIEGANWSDEEQKLVDCDNRKIYQEMPALQLNVIFTALFEERYLNSRYYQCPMYTTGLRERLDSDFSKGMITNVPLFIGSNSQPSFWTKRGTALLCQKEE